MSQPNPVEPENPLDLNWANDVAFKLGQLSLKADSDLSVSRVTVNVTTFLRLHRYWEEDRARAPFLPKQAALSHYGLLRGVAGGLIEDLEKLVDEVTSWQRSSRRGRGGMTLAEKVKTTFDTPRVKTILAQLQYIEGTENLIIEVWRYGAQRANVRTPNEEDNQRLGRARRSIRSLIMNRKVALKYVNQRLAEEDATLLNTTRSTVDGSDSDRPSRPTVLLSRRSIHAEQLTYLDEVLEIGDDNRESIQRQDQLIHNLLERWTRSQLLEADSSDEESVFDQDPDEEAATGGYGGPPSSFYRSQTMPTRVNDHATPQTAATSSRTLHTEPPLPGQRTGSGPAGRQPSLSVKTTIIPAERPTPPPLSSTYQSARPGSARPPLSSTSYNATTGPPYSATTAKSPHSRAFSMSQAEQKPDMVFQLKPKSLRDSGYVTENVEHPATGTVIEDSDEEDVKVYWQIAIGRKIYPYENSKLSEIADVSLAEAEQYIRSHDNAVTEIPTSTVIEAALQRKKKYLYEKVPARGRFCEMWRIQTALKYNPDIRDLVQLSNVISRERQEASARPPQQAGHTTQPQARHNVPPPPPALSHASSYPAQPYPTQVPPPQQASRTNRAVNFSDNPIRDQYQPPPQQWTHSQHPPDQHPYPQPSRQQQPGPNTGLVLRRTTSTPTGGGYGYTTQPQPQPLPSQSFEGQAPPRSSDYRAPHSRSHRNDRERRKSRPVRPPTSSSSDSYSDDDPRLSGDRRKSDDTARRIRVLERENRQAREREDGRARNSLMRRAAAVTSGIIASGAGVLELMEGL